MAVSGELQFLRVKDVAAKLGCSVQGVWKWQRQGKIPSSKKLGCNTVWLSTEIDNFIQDRFNVSDQRPA